MWSIQRLRALKRRSLYGVFNMERLLDEEPFESFGLTAKELDEYERLYHETHLTHGKLRRAWLERKASDQRST